MTTPEPPDGERPSLQDRLAEFESEDDLFDDEYDDAAEDTAATPQPPPEAAEPAAHEGDVTSYDDSAFAAADDEPQTHEMAELTEVAEPTEMAEPTEVPEPEDVPEPGDTVVLEHPTEDSTGLAVPAEPAAAVTAALPVAQDVPAEPAAAAPVEEEPAATEGEGGRRSRRARSTGRSSRRLTLPVVALLIMTALMAAATAYVWLEVRENHRTEDARKDGLEASRDAARLLFSYDYRTLDKDFQAGRALTTGEFRDQYEKTTTKVVTDVAKQYKAVVKANVVGSGIVSASPDKVVAVVYVNQVTTSTRVTGEKVDLSRVRMTLRRVGDKWLVTSVNAL